MATQQTPTQPGPSSSLSVKTIGSGALGLVFAVFIAWLIFGWYIPNRKEKRKEKAKIQAIADSILLSNQRNYVPPPIPEFPEEGYGIATTNSPIKAKLYPGRSYLYPSVDAKYVSVRNPAIYFADTAIKKYNANSHLWKKIRETEFYVYPWKEGDTLNFSWGLRKIK